MLIRISCFLIIFINNISRATQKFCENYHKTTCCFYEFKLIESATTSPNTLILSFLLLSFSIDLLSIFPNFGANLAPQMH